MNHNGSYIQNQNVWHYQTDAPKQETVKMHQNDTHSNSAPPKPSKRTKPSFAMKWQKQYSFILLSNIKHPALKGLIANKESVADDTKVIITEYNDFSDFIHRNERKAEIIAEVIDKKIKVYKFERILSKYNKQKINAAKKGATFTVEGDTDLGDFASCLLRGRPSVGAFYITAGCLLSSVSDSKKEKYESNALAAYQKFPNSMIQRLKYQQSNK